MILLSPFDANIDDFLLPRDTKQSSKAAELESRSCDKDIYKLMQCSGLLRDMFTYNNLLTFILSHCLSSQYLILSSASKAFYNVLLDVLLISAMLRIFIPFRVPFCIPNFYVQSHGTLFLEGLISMLVIKSRAI